MAPWRGTTLPLRSHRNQPKCQENQCSRRETPAVSVQVEPYSPELQPAEHLWPILDEPLANQHFETLADLERAIADRCRVLDGDQLPLGTNFHWWPKPAK